MKHAFQAAGLNTDTVRLEALLTDLHKHHSGDKRKIAGGLAVAVLNDKTLLGVIIDYYIAGHSVSVPHQTDASNDGGRFACEPQPMLASVVPINRRRTDAERAGAVRYAVSIYDTYRLEDGTPIGDVKLSSIPRIKQRYRKHTALLEMIYLHAQASDQFTSVREAVGVADIQRMIQKAAEASDEA
jgi:hypothetical protein